METINEPIIKDDEGKTIAIISYLTWIGLLIAFVMNTEKKNAFAKYHIRQSLLIMLAGLALGFVSWIPVLGWLIGLVGAVVLFIAWVMGLISAINGERKEAPLVGRYAQEWFRSI